MWSRASFQRIKGVGVAALLGLAGMAASGVLASSGARAEPPRPWLFGGADLSNTHAMLSPTSNINSPVQINPRTASKLAAEMEAGHHGRHHRDADSGFDGPVRAGHRGIAL